MSIESSLLPPGERRTRPAAAAGALRQVVAVPEAYLVLCVAGVLNLWNLSINRDANLFYAAAVKSMAGNLHDFLYNAMDPGGLMTVDKPPLSDWVQALSVKLFGFNSWALLAPQAVMGMVAAVLMYDLVRRGFGRVAGFAAGIVLATTPTIVAMSRHNNPDELLVMLSVTAAWCFIRALETRRTRWMLWTGVFIGLGFETKMGVALMVVPGFALAWVWMRWDASLGVRENLRWLAQLVSGGAAMTVVAVAWPVFVWLTPATDRPWISSTPDNSIWQLIVGYNGLGRIGGQAGSTVVRHVLSAHTRLIFRQHPVFLAHGLLAGGLTGVGARFGTHGLGVGGGATPGNPGVFRLLDGALGGQVGWLLGAGVLSIGVLLVMTRLRRRDPRTGFLIAIGGSFVVVAVIWSTASGIFHPYYMSFLAPWLAALVGALVGIGRQRRLLAPLLLGAALATELIVLRYDTGGDLAALRYLSADGTVVCGLVLLCPLPDRWRDGVFACACAVLLAAPVTYAAQTLDHPSSRTFPAGGPALPPAPVAGAAARRHRLRTAAGGFGGPDSALNAAAAWASVTGGGTVAVESQSTAAESILAGHDNVAGIGGFSGVETSVTPAWIRRQVRTGRLLYVLGGPESLSHASDGRLGSTRAVAAAERTAARLHITYDGRTFTLYMLNV